MGFNDQEIVALAGALSLGVRLSLSLSLASLLSLLPFYVLGWGKKRCSP